MALVDIAIETYWSRSPIRWWVAPPAIIYAAASIWLWRPGAWAAKRWGWEGAAAWSGGGLLLLLAVTAWLPDGRSNGVRLLLQPTASVLTAVAAAAVILATFMLVRALGVLSGTARLVARAVVVALAVYALASLGLAMYERVPFATLFQGGAAWQRLPRWLQGAFVGAFALLPLALLGQVIRIVDHLRRKQPVRVLLHQATALGMALVIATSGVVPTTGGRGGVDGARYPSAPAPYTAARGAAPASFEVASSRLSKALTLAQGLADAVDPALVDVSARAKSFDGSIDVAFIWVRDHVRFEPYAGLLRGARGALIARAANSLDRSLLLAE